MRRNPRVTILCYDPRQPLRYLEVRGTVVAMTEDGATRHLDELASKYVGRPRPLLRRLHPVAVRRDEIPVLCLIEPTHVVALDATAGQRGPMTRPRLSTRWRSQPRTRTS